MRIKKFYGASENAVQPQYAGSPSRKTVLVAISAARGWASRRVSTKWLQILSVTLFDENAHFTVALQPGADPRGNLLDDPNQLILLEV